MFLEIEGITKRYKNVFAVNDVSFMVDKGEVAALIGPNGAGKSTTIDIICGLRKADNGIVYIDGTKVDGFNCSKKIGYLSGEMTFRPKITIKEYLQLINHYKYDGHFIDDVDRYIDLFKLNRYRDTYVTNLSYGNQRKVGIIAALLGNPELIILDEPTNGIDTEGNIRLKECIEEAVRNNSAVLISSHMLDFVQAICNKSIFINNGSIVGKYDNRDDLEYIYKQIIMNEDKSLKLSL